MATGENFIRISSSISDRRKQRLIVNKHMQQKIESEIKKLQAQRDALYDDDNLSDDELKMQEYPIQEKINLLIDSMFETKDEAKKRFYN
jgi:hypothetical protein